MASVYVIGFPNGKCYVGVTSGKVEKRFTKHVRDARSGSKLVFHRALQKYGPENVRVTTVVSDVSWAQAQDLEIWWISRLGTFGRSGYNMTLGGDGTTGHEHTHEHRAYMSDLQKGNTAALGYKHTDEARARQSRVHRRNQEETITEMVGRTVGLGTILGENEEETKRQSQLILSYRCECGKLGAIQASEVNIRSSICCHSCAAKAFWRCKQEKIIAEMVGKTYGLRFVKSEDKRRTKQEGKLYLTVRCECGTEQSVLAGRLEGSIHCHSCANRERNRNRKSAKK